MRFRLVVLALAAVALVTADAAAAIFFGGANGFSSLRKIPQART
jgi:hypothetical protein